MRRWGLSVWGLAAALLAGPAGAQGELARLTGWLAGEWNNHEQVWAQKGELKPGETLSDPIAHTHHLFVPVAMPRLGAQVFYVQQAAADSLAAPYRQRLYRFSEDAAGGGVKLEIFGLPEEASWRDAHLVPERFASLDPASLKAFPGCEVLWRYQAEEAAFLGSMKQDACVIQSTRLNKKIFINDRLRLSATELWINDQARDENGQHVFGSKTDTPLKARKLAYYTGWVAINRGGKEAAKEAAFSLRRDLLLHSEGKRLPLRLDDGSATPYDIELARLTYQRTTVPILKLALIDRASGKSLAYTWASTDSDRLGFNLGWVQVGLTRKAEHTAFGFDASKLAR